ncbi:MAG: hypothetical protein AB1346_11595 [Thermodesulfobacteriota bacterium]
MRPIREYMGDRRVAAALAAAAVLAVGYRLWQSREITEGPPAPVVEESPAEAILLPAPEPGKVPQPAASQPMPAGWAGPAWNWGRNPFLPPSAERAPGSGGAGAEEGAADPSLPALRGTVVAGESSAAIFRWDRAGQGDVLVPAGGKIGEWTVVKVEPYRVSLRRGKETRTLELYRQ